ncbi:MAG TPA: hypothetical protein VD731_03220 [Nitrosopumilaceae archaeon]|nr:hypothetical protein [Nitrosopumilaceae archaeon]
MKHNLFSDGNTKRISWVIQSGESVDEQERDHVDRYMDKVTDEQSKYITLHVGIFWGIGRFIIKNEDTVNVMLDSKSMYEHLKGNSDISDIFIENRVWFIKQLIEQRKLKINYHLIDPEENLASKLL